MQFNSKWLFAAGLMLAGQQLCTAAERPNFVLLLTDDQSYHMSLNDQEAK
jgi:hypothetical protein